MKVGQKVRPDTKCSRRLEDFLQLPSKASTNLGASQLSLLTHGKEVIFLASVEGGFRLPRKVAAGMKDSHVASAQKRRPHCE